MIGQVLADIGDNGEIPRRNRQYADVPSLGFPCREVSIQGGTHKVGLLTFYTLELSGQEIVVLYAKHGGPGNLSLKEQNIIREIYNQEVERRRSNHE